MYWMLRAPGGGFWGWNSFKARPYVTTKKNAERFCWWEHASNWLERMEKKFCMSGTLAYVRGE